MSMDGEMVRRMARLARLDLPESRVAPLTKELDRILEWMAHLDSVDTEGVPAMVMQTPGEESARRDDAVTDGGLRDELMSNAPEAEGPFFTVPKVVDQ